MDFRLCHPTQFFTGYKMIQTGTLDFSGQKFLYRANCLELVYDTLVCCTFELLKSTSLRNPDDRGSSTSQISLIFLYVVGSSEVSTR
jgi:hypothetical protein